MVPLIIAGVVLVAGAAVALTIKKLLIICDPSEVVIFSGPARLDDQKVGYRSLRNGRRLRIPLLERVDVLDLTNMTVNVAVRGAYSQGGIPLNIDGVANIKLDGDPPGLDNAVERLLGKNREEIIRLARETLEGNLRGVLAKLTPEEVNEDKERFAAELVEEAEDDLFRLGLRLDILKIQTVTDDVGYLEALGRKMGAELVSNARIAEADRTAESEQQAASNLQQTRLSQVQAMREIAAAEAEKRVRSAVTQRAAEIAKEQSRVVSELAKAEGEVAVQHARIEQVKLLLDADIVAPAEAYKQQRQAWAKAQVASIREDGEATARGLRDLAAAWTDAGSSARDIFLLEKLRTLIAVMVGTVKNVHVDTLTIIGETPDGGQTTAGTVASLIEQLRGSADIDVPELLKQLAIGTKAVGPTPPTSVQPARVRARPPAAPTARPTAGPAATET